VRIAVLFFGILLLVASDLQAQFAPQAGQPGSTAIHRDDAGILAWGDSVSVTRGWLDAADTSLGRVSFGMAQSTRGKADGDVLSLGDGGWATYYFANPITDGPGADFAVFENGFLNPADSTMAYLELAFVEVSTDGLNWVRFAAESHTDTTLQCAGTGQYMDARKVHNLAGKYIANWGTPFDLSELSPALSAVHYVRISDVVGALQKNIGSSDAQLRLINDPYPTPFPTGGFDLDAIAVLHTSFPAGAQENALTNPVSVYPNPSRGMVYIQGLRTASYVLYSGQGQVIAKGALQEGRIHLDTIPAGLYLLELRGPDGAPLRQSIRLW
jgi:hypothetical protein